MLDCWNSDPIERPSFLELHDRLVLEEKEIPQSLSSFKAEPRVKDIHLNEDGEYWNVDDEHDQ